MRVAMTQAMTRTIDNFLVKLAFDRAELEQVHSRQFWYAAIGIFTGLTLCALWLAVSAWTV